MFARLGYSPRNDDEAAEEMRTVAAREELKRLRATPPPVKAYLLTVAAIPEPELVGLFTSFEKAFIAAERRASSKGLIIWQEDNTVGRVTGNRLWYSNAFTGYIVREMDVQ